MDDGSRPAVEAASVDHAADVGWEPADWTDVLRRKRRSQLAGTATMVLLFFVVTPLLRWTVTDRPLGWTYWLYVVVTLIIVGETVHSWVSAEGRASWERDARQQVRVEHAWRHHVGIGAEDRARVTERARAVNTVSKVAFVGWPLLAGVLVAGILQDPELPTWPAVPVIAAGLLLVARSVRRRGRARRWLADPLPRDDDEAG